MELSRRLGRAQVTGAPDWSGVDGPAMAAWWRDQLGASGGFGGLALERKSNPNPPVPDGR
ncbi:hypothetical protein [Kitasatospora purpeofusca]|uniref:hypothetical protein n=1 Tax=Kitasatospora purpeofusca TaxID=67352 RepID=UPI0037F59339